MIISNNKAITIVITLSACACFWFGGIACLNIIMKIFVVPALSRLEIPARELRLSETHSNGDDIYLMGLKTRHPVQGLTANAIAPIFENHSLEGLGIFLNNGNNPAGNILIRRYPDDLSIECGFDLSPTNKILNSIILFNGSRFGFLDQIFSIKMSDFNWWNLLRDIRVVYVLVNKAIFLPTYYEDGNLFHLRTDHLSGYFCSGKYGKDKKDKYIKELWFAENGSLFNIVIIDKSGRDYSEFLSNLSAISESEAENIINSYSARSVSKDIEIASSLSRKVTIKDLESLKTLTQQHKAAGDKTSTVDLDKELLYLKSSHK